MNRRTQKKKKLKIQGAKKEKEERQNTNCQEKKGKEQGFDSFFTEKEKKEIYFLPQQ